MDREKKFKLIELWEQQPVLWDPTNRDRLRKDAQKNAREVIAAKLGVHEEMVKKAINGLKAQFSGECTKVRKGGKSGAGGTEVYVSKWLYYSALQFLIRGKSGAGEFDSLNETSQIRNELIEDANEDNLTGDNYSSSSSSSSTNFDLQPSILDVEKPSDPKPNPRKRNNKRNKSASNELNLLSKCVDILSEPTEPKKPKTRADILGESTSSLLETLWTDDFILYKEYAMALRNLNNKFEDIYEKKQIFKTKQKLHEQEIMLSSNESLSTSKGGSEKDEYTSLMSISESYDISTIESEVEVAADGEITPCSPIFGEPREPGSH